MAIKFDVSGTCKLENCGERALGHRQVVAENLKCYGTNSFNYENFIPWFVQKFKTYIKTYLYKSGSKGR